MKVVDLRTEYKINPIGVGEKTPAFSWKIQSEEQNVMQVSYAITVQLGSHTVWDSGIVYSDQSICIPYQGEELLPQKKYTVCVRIQDNYANDATETGFFEMGLMDEKNFPGTWITHTMADDETRVPSFELDLSCEKKISNARLYATACGIYEVELNKKRIGEEYFAPGWTTYQKRVLWQTYDITSYMQSENNISIQVGNGWYKGIIGFAYRPNFYGDQVAIKAAIYVEYEDGSEQWITTDQSWDVYKSQILESEIYNGEVIDFTKEREYVGKAVELDVKKQPIKLVNQTYSPVKIIERIPVQEKIIAPNGDFILDFGQNLTGFVEITLPHAVKGEIVIHHAESLDKDGNLYTENLRRAKAIDRIIYKDTDEGKIVKPHFTFHGFRYISVEGVDHDVDLSLFTACVLHTEMDITGSFSCNMPLVNRLQDNIQWSARDNFLDIPTDCPQRDERLGWTGDAQFFSSTAAYNLDVALFFRKWLVDVALEETEEYGPAHVVPNVLGNIEAGAGWSDSITIIPWNMFQTYGDARFLENQYESMVRYIEYIRRHCNQNGLWQTGLQYGDWLALDHEEGNTSGATDQYLAANSFYLRSLEILYSSAEILNKQEDYETYKALYETTKRAYQKEYFTETGRIVSETQTGCVLPLEFHLVREDHKDRVVETLVNNIYDHKMHLTTGFMGTPYLCQVLSDNGQHELATKIFLSEDLPSWLYSVKMGATTIWERWDSILPDGSFNNNGMNSLNHYANGAIGDWMFQKIAGIKALTPGYKMVSIAPMLTPGLYQVSSSFESVYGRIESNYSCEDGVLSVDIVIPPNTKAEIHLPEKEDVILAGSGEFHFEYKIKTDLTPVPFSMFSLVSQVVTTDTARNILEKEAPETLNSPIMGILWEMPLFRLGGVMPEGGMRILNKIIQTLNVEANEHVVPIKEN